MCISDCKCRERRSNFKLIKECHNGLKSLNMSFGCGLHYLSYYILFNNFFAWHFTVGVCERGVYNVTLISVKTHIKEKITRLLWLFCFRNSHCGGGRKEGSIRLSKSIQYQHSKDRYKIYSEHFWQCCLSENEMPSIHILKLIQNRVHIYIQGIDFDFTVNIFDNAVANALDPFSTRTE